MSEVKENKGFVTAEYLKKRAQDAKHVKTRSCELLQLKPDSQVLDVGCGPATDTLLISDFIGANGRVVGVDSDPDMVEKANAEVRGLKTTKNIKHVVGSALSLPFADGEFDRLHAERLFQVLPKSASLKVVAEMKRVLCSKGRIVLVDTDWGSGSVNFSDDELERRLLTYFAMKMRPNGYAGRQLLGLLKDNGFEELAVEVLPFVCRDFAETPFTEWLTTEALKNGVANKNELSSWNKELTQKTAQGVFLSHTNMVLVSGRKP